MKKPAQIKILYDGSINFMIEKELCKSLGKFGYLPTESGCFMSNEPTQRDITFELKNTQIQIGITALTDCSAPCPKNMGIGRKIFHRRKN